MPAQFSYPGVYIQEVPSGIHTISGVATSIAAFVGYTSRGVDHLATRIFSFADFERGFGGLAIDSELSYAVRHFFDNGGTDAYIVRVPKSDSAAATVSLAAGVAPNAGLALRLRGMSRGAWANRVVVAVDYAAVTDNKSFNLTLTDRTTGAQEVFSDLSADPASPRFSVKMLNDVDTGSELVTAIDRTSLTGVRPAQTGTVGATIDLADIAALDITKAYSVGVSASTPPSLATTRNVVVISAGEPRPTSVLGLARLLERKLNAELQKVEPGAIVRATTNAAGDGVRVWAVFDPELVSGAN